MISGAVFSTIGRTVRCRGLGSGETRNCFTRGILVINDMILPTCTNKGFAEIRPEKRSPEETIFNEFYPKDGERAAVGVVAVKRWYGGRSKKKKKKPPKLDSIIHYSQRCFSSVPNIIFQQIDRLRV